MRIRTKLSFSSIVMMLLVGSFITTALFLTSVIDESYQKQQLAERIAETSFQLALLQSDYIAYPSQRLQTQWTTTYEVLIRLLNEASPLFSRPNEKAIFNEVRKGTENNKLLFEQLVANLKQRKNPSVIQDLSNQIALGYQVRGPDVLQLAALSRNDATSAERAFSLMTILLGFCVMGVAIWSYLAGLFIAQSLRVLSEGTRIIAKGDLEYKIHIKNNDEIGELAEAFNDMSGKLKESYITLERKVHDRTQDLEEAKAKDEAMLASIVDGVIATDKEGRIVMVNQSFERILGWKASEVYGKLLSDVVPMIDENDDRIPHADRLVNRMLRHEVTTTNSTNGYYQRKDGTIFPVALIVSPILISEELVGVFKIFRDITYEKAVDKAKAEFVSLASHQLKTPPTAIKLLTERILNDRVGELTAKQREYFSDIRSSNQRMIDLINTLLSVSRIELGTFDLQLAKKDIKNIVENIFDGLKPNIDKRQLRYKMTYPYHIAQISIDESLFRIIISNLAMNALNYTSAGGIVHVSCYTLNKGQTLGTHIMNENSCVVSITDTGCGIPSDQQGKLFTRFFRATNAKEEHTDGTGLGLYIAKMILDNTGGFVWFSSKENRGSTFYVAIPMTGMRTGQDNRIMRS